MIAKISTRLETTADKAWSAVKKTETFLYVTRGLLGMAHTQELPREWQEGQTVRMRLRPLHLPLGWTHELRILRVDEQKREIYTNEKGGFIKVWNHLIKIVPDGESRCRYTDQIEVDAGLLTLPVWLYVHIFFRYRQARWRVLAKSL